MVTGGFIPPPETYLFVDGAYLRKVADEWMQELYGVPAEINFAALRNLFSHTRRVFYYDCLNDKQRTGESEVDLHARICTQQAIFDAIQSLPGFHVRLGSLSGTNRKLRQKKVDVLLAVEALDHAFRKNAQQICLIAGDLDFAPLVDSLVRLGTYVQIMYQPRSAARGLYSAADVGVPITIDTILNWTTQEFRRQHPMPYIMYGGNPPTWGKPVKTGDAGNSTVELHKRGDTFRLYCASWNNQPLVVEHPDVMVLQRYFAMVYAPIVWES